MDRKRIETYRLSLFGRMAMGVAHDVDNHLSVVIGFSEIVRMAASDPKKVIDGSGKILSAGEKIAALIRQYSRYARPHPAQRELFAAGEAIPELLLFARYDLGRNGSVVETPASWPPVLVLGDRNDFGLAVLSLLFNAAEAMGDGGGKISIGTSRDDAGWAISISDGGPGIPAGLEEKVFEEGFTTRPEPFRTGMGLPVARAAVAGAGGTLLIGNAPGGGCVATIRLPVQPGR